MFQRYFVTQRDCEFPAELVHWADACLLVYSITDRASFDTARRLLGRLSGVAATAEQRGGGGTSHQQPVLALLANKADLEHLRMVSGSFLNITLCKQREKILPINWCK